MRVKEIAAMCFAGMVLGLAGCGSSEPVVTTANAGPPAPAAPAKTEPAPEFIAAGPIVVENQVDVLAQRDGMVARIMADTGATVREGQLLAELDSRQLAAELEAAQAKVRSISAELKHWEAEAAALEADEYRVREMHKLGLSTKQQLDHAEFRTKGSHFQAEREQADLEQAKFTAQSLQLELEKTRIVAPFSGMVARRYVRAGERVGSGSRLFWITGNGPLQVRFTLPQRFIGKVSRGDMMSVTTEDNTAAGRPARVVQVSPVVDPASGMFEVVAEIQGPAGALRPGMTAQLKLPDVQ